MKNWDTIKDVLFIHFSLFLSALFVSVISNFVYDDSGIWLSIIFACVFVLGFLLNLFQGILKEKTQRMLNKSSTLLDGLYYQTSKEGNLENILHDVSTPMSVISECVRRLELEESERDKYIILLKQSVDSINKILMSYEKNLSDEKMEIINIRKSVSKITNFYKNRLESNDIHLISNLDDFYLLGDCSKFERVISNLLINAIEELAVCKKKRKRIKIKSSIRKEYLYISICDNGYGLKLKNKEDIFMKGFSLKKENHKGIGLFFVKNVVEKDFGGNIYVLSLRGIGTRFVIKIPLN